MPSRFRQGSTELLIERTYCVYINLDKYKCKSNLLETYAFYHVTSLTLTPFAITALIISIVAECAILFKLTGTLMTMVQDNVKVLFEKMAQTTTFST